MADDNSGSKVWVSSIIVALIGAAATITVAIVNKSSASSTSTVSSVPPTKAGTSVPHRDGQNFAGTWQLAMEDWNGFDKRQRFTVTQTGKELLITGLTKGTNYEIDADGSAVCRFVYGPGLSPYRDGAGEAPALVQTFTVSLEGSNKLVFESTTQYNVAMDGHGVGTDRHVQHFERVSPN
jgi:hypothetical protein